MGAGVEGQRPFLSHHCVDRSPGRLIDASGPARPPRRPHSSGCGSGRHSGGTCGRHGGGNGGAPPRALPREPIARSPNRPIVDSIDRRHDRSTDESTDIPPCSRAPGPGPGPRLLKFLSKRAVLGPPPPFRGPRALRRTRPGPRVYGVLVRADRPIGRSADRQPIARSPDRRLDRSTTRSIDRRINRASVRSPDRAMLHPGQSPDWAKGRSPDRDLDYGMAAVVPAVLPTMLATAIARPGNRPIGRPRRFLFATKPLTTERKDGQSIN